VTRSSTFVRLMVTVALAIAGAITVPAEAGGISAADSHCNDPEDQEAAACTPVPWSCTLGLWPATASAPPRP
jgi:hypothetical protein